MNATLLPRPLGRKDDSRARTSTDLAPEERPPEVAAPRKVRRRRIRRALAVLALAFTVVVAYSYGTYLTAPGSAPVSVRTVDWLRDHGFASIVNSGEQWWYTHHLPRGGRAAISELPSQAHTANLDTHPGDTIRLIQSVAQAGEGVWQGVSGLAIPPSAAQQTYIRPDRDFPSVAISLVRFDQNAIRTTYVPGSKQPGGTGWAWNDGIPVTQRPTLTAAFNAGFKFKDTAGGVFTEGRHAVRPLADGLASIVIRTDGTVEVDRWGRDANLTPDVASVRQNLHLIVDHGQVDPGLKSDRGLKWGTARSQRQFTWRSGIGVDAKGRLIYAAGAKASLTDLATALDRAGAVRAMELDMHDQVVTFNWFRTTNATTVGSKLTPSMQRPPYRFLAPDQRDFLAVQAR